ncbi:TPA: hypothetical protein N0F65_010754 [Lagenidium giganteum]|uniref:Major facilitator superfamily (MFS) profile domain-containing protein n=1 Tax=Lagenidium giganteum TaxID=4803 RepID=A0AAV2YT16_9STRA|nr:TPA: hypothetical protein N0F65_010754 [Lagenidium giganteum]
MGINWRFLIDGGEASALIPLKLLYVIHYAAFSTQTYLPMYFETKEHFTKFQIGVLLTLPCICSILGPPIWGLAADLCRNQKLIHIICLVSAALLMFSLRYVTSFDVMCLMVFIANFQTQPTWSLLDQTAMSFLSQVGGDYGKQRLYGAVGYGAGGYLAGTMAAAIGIAWCFNMVLGLSVISLYLLVRYIPSFDREEGKVAFAQSMQHILQQRDLLVLFVIVLFVGVMAGVIDSFLFLYLFNLNNSNAGLVGVVIAVETTSELPLFFYANKIIERYGTPKCIIERYGTPKCVIFGLLCYGARLVFYVFVQNPWMALPFEALHGVTFGLIWAAFTNYVYKSAPYGTQGTMIGLLAAVQKGMGGGLGTLVGGYVYDKYGPRTMWAITALCVPVALFFTAIFTAWANPNPSKGEYASIKPSDKSYGSSAQLEEAREVTS